MTFALRAWPQWQSTGKGTPALDLSVTTGREGGSVAVYPQGKLDRATVGKLEAVLRHAEASEHERIVVDLQGLTFIDSTAVRTLLLFKSRSRADAARVSYIASSEGAVARAFEAAGLDEVLDYRVPG